MHLFSPRVNEEIKQKMKMEAKKIFQLKKIKDRGFGFSKRTKKMS